MKVFTKSFFALLFCMFGVLNVSAKAEKVHATFENPTNTNTTWTPDASGVTLGTFTWSTTYYNQLRNIGLPTGDITSYKKLVVDCEIKSGNQFRILIYKGGSNLTLYASDGLNEFILADTLKTLYPDTYNEFLLDCSEICLSGNNGAAPGEAVIKDVYLETYNDEGEQVFATFESPTNTNTTWTPDASGVTLGTFTWSTTYYNQLRNIGLPTGDISKYKKLVVDTEIKSGNQFRILIYKGGSNLTLYASDGLNEFILADTLKALYPDTYNEFLLACDEICLSGNNGAAPGEAVIKSVYLETYPENETVDIPDIVYEEDPGKPAGDFVDFTEAFSSLQPRINIGEDSHPIVLGNGDVVVGQRSKDVVADLSAYSKLTMVTTPGLKLVLYMNHEIDAKQNAGDYTDDDAGKYVFMDVQADENGLIEVDLTQFDKQDLNCICLPWDNNNKGTVWYILLTEKEVAKKTIVLYPGVWAADNAQFAAYAWNEKGNAWLPFIPANGIDGAYGTQIPENYTGIILTRINPEGTDTNPWNNVWNQTDDIDFTAIADQTIFTITGWGEGENAKSTYTTTTISNPLDLAKAALQDAINKVKAFNLAGLADAIATAQAAVNAEDATIESLQAAGATFEAGVKAYITENLNTAIPMIESLNVEALTNAIDAAKAAVAKEDVTVEELADAMLGLLDNARPYIVEIMRQTVDVCKPLGIDVATAEALLSQTDPEASTTELASALLSLSQNAVPAIQGVLTNLKAYMTAFSNGAAEAMAADFAKLEADVKAGDIAAVKNDIVTLMTNGKSFLQTDIEKLEGYAEVLENEAITADVAAMKAGVEAGSFASLLAGVEKFKADFLAAAPGFVNKVEFAAAGYKEAGKTNAMEQLEDAIEDAKQAIAAEDATIVTVGLAVRNLIVAVKTHIAANSTYTIAGTKDLTGTDEDWQIVEANNMTKSAEDYMYEWTAENITVNADNQPQFKVVITDIDGKQTWIPASEEGNDHNWKITPYVIGGEGEFDITITYNAKTQEISVVNKDWAPTLAAAEALVDMNAVAVGKLLAAIETAKAATGTTADKEALQAAIDQFKADNAPLETDLTTHFSALTDYKNWVGATGFTATNFCPAVPVNDGTTKQVCEKYETNCNSTGDVFYQTVTGLTAGTYKIELYGGAAFTFGRGFSSEAFTNGEGDTNSSYSAGDHIDENTGMKLYATTSEGTYEKEIPIYYATNFPDGAATVVLDGVVIGSNGEVKLGLNKTSKSTNWHVVQLKGVTAQVLAKDLYATDQTVLTNLIAEANTLAADESMPEGKEAFKAVIDKAEEAITTKANWYNTSEIGEIITELKNAVQAYEMANRFTYDGVAYIIDAESGKFMAAGHDYGTRGIVNEIGLDLTFSTNADNTVDIETGVSNGGDNHFLGSNLYMDSSSYGWILKEQEFGFYIQNVEGQYISLDQNDNLVMSEEPHLWIIVTKEGVRAELLEEMAEATVGNPVDATRLIVAQNFNRNDQRNTVAWTVSDNCTNKNLSGGNQVNNCAESFHSLFTISQVISDAPAGFYQLTAQGFYRQDEYEGDAPEAPAFFANGVNGNVPVLAEGGPNGMSTASEAFAAGEYTIEPITFEVKEDGMMYIGVFASTNTQWVIWDNFQLKYFGTQNPDPTVGISTLSSEKNNGAIFNLNGQKVNKAQKGLYIMNGKKVFVK